MKAVVLPLAVFLPHLSGESVILMSDNTTGVAYLLWNRGGTVSRILCCMVAEVVLWIRHHSVSLTARNIPEKKKKNSADQLSHSNQVLPMEWSLLPRVFQDICKVFGHPHLKSLWHPLQCQAPALLLTSSGPDGLEAECVPAPLGPSVYLCLPAVCSAQAGLAESASFDRALVGSGDPIVATERVVCRSFVPVGWQTTRTSTGVKFTGPATHAEVPSRTTSRMEVVQHLVWKAGFSRGADLWCSTAALHQSKWTRFLGWCDQWGVDPCKVSVPQIAGFFLYLRQELDLSVPTMKVYRAALNHVFPLTGIDLTGSTVVSQMFCSFKRSCPPQEVRHPNWNLSLVLWCLSWPPFEPLKMASDKHLTGKISFLLCSCVIQGG